MENCLATASKNRINPFNSVVFPTTYQKLYVEPPIFNDQKLFGLALDSFNVRKHISSATDMFENDKKCCFEARIHQMCHSNVDKAESETPFCDLIQNKSGICFEARSTKCM